MRRGSYYGKQHERAADYRMKCAEDMLDAFKAVLEFPVDRELRKLWSGDL